MKNNVEILGPSRIFLGVRCGIVFQSLLFLKYLKKCHRLPDINIDEHQLVEPSISLV